MASKRKGEGIKEYRRIMVVEPAVADSITGAQRNKYIFRTARKSSQDALAVAAAIAASKPGATMVVLAQSFYRNSPS